MFIKNIFEKIQNNFSAETEMVIAGVWPDQDTFLNAAKELKKRGYQNFSAITPCPVHGLEDILSIKRSWIPWVTFLFSLTGCLFGLWFTWWTSAVSWPLNVGGKPFWSLPAFIPVIFELTILFGALSSVAALLYTCGLPSLNPPILHKDLSSHKFALFFKLKDTQYSIEELKKAFNELNAEQVMESKF